MKVGLRVLQSAVCLADQRAGLMVVMMAGTWAVVLVALLVEMLAGRLGCMMGRNLVLKLFGDKILLNLSIENRTLTVSVRFSNAPNSVEKPWINRGFSPFTARYPQFNLFIFSWLNTIS
mgnify:CR=1 FL=1